MASQHTAIGRSTWLVCASNQIFGWLERISRRRVLTCLAVMVLTIGARIALLRRVPIPQPRVSDEFGYLLGAETFVSGRLTNPMHPMWEHFETFQQLMRPTYMSKYPPGQSLFLAIGWKFFGHPWFGVLLSFGLFAACLCWMLQNWVPPIYALIGTVITLAQISILGYWMNSYWGGAVAACGGCLLLGTLPRLARRVKSKDVVLAALGLVVLANTRPYEGLVMSAAAGLGLLLWRHRRRKALVELFAIRCLIPLVIVGGTAALLDGYYNYRVTKNVLVMPWNLYFQDYFIASPWIIFPPQNPPEYRNSTIESTWENQNIEFQKIKSNPLLKLRPLHNVLGFYSSWLLLFPVALGIILSRSYRLWVVFGIFLSVWCGLFIESFMLPHYIAGSVGLLPLLAVYGFRWMRVIGGRYGPILLFTIAGLLCIQGRGQDAGRIWEVRRDLSPRMIAMSEAMKYGGPQLIFVRHAPNYVESNDECVYNSADIDASKIVWARDMGEVKNQKLMAYYKHARKTWLYQPDISPAILTPYEPSSDR